MHRELVIGAGPGEWRAVLIEDGVAVELRVERGDGAEADSIHLGRVRHLLPALGAALIDIGGDRPAFLPQSGILPRGRRLDEGERVVVQIRREAQGGKAARLTTAVALRGRSVELVLGRRGIVGDNTLTPETRARLLAAVEAITASADEAPHPPAARVPPSPRERGEGGGEGPLRNKPIGLRLLIPATVDELIAEAAELHGRWREIGERAAHLDPPARLHPAPTFAAALAGALPAPTAVLVDEPAAIPELRAAFPDAELAVAADSQWAVDLDALFEEALSPSLALPGAGSVHIEATRAAIMIDVDSGTPEAGSPESSALAVDLAAASLIARQLRLRNLGGGIVVDFVGLDDRRARERVHAALGRALAADPARPQLLGWTRLGHFELVRPRRTRPLAEGVIEPASSGELVKNTLTVALEALHALRREERAQPGRRWRLMVAPDVAAALAGSAAGALRALEQRLGRPIAIAAEPGRMRQRFETTPL